MTSLLDVRDLEVSYGAVPVLHGINLSVNKGEIRSILGANGAGKTTTLKTIAGVLKPRHGEIRMGDGPRIDGRRADQIRRAGLSWIPEGREIFVTLSVYENLLLGAYVVRDRQVIDERVEAMFRRFPVLEQRRHQSAGNLSGGEQQMLAIVRALMGDPHLLLMDEPSLGLAPRVVSAVFDLITEIRSEGVSILLVEQNARKALAVSDYTYVLEMGRISAEGPSAEIATSPAIRKAYLGG